MVSLTRSRILTASSLVIPAQAGIQFHLFTASMRRSARFQRAGHFLLRGQEKVTKEKATPAQRSPGILPSEFASALRGSLNAHPCTCNELARVVRTILRTFLRALAAVQGPR